MECCANIPVAARFIQSSRLNGTRYFSHMKSRQIIFVTKYLVHEVSHGCRGRQVISRRKKVHIHSNAFISANVI